MKRYRIYISHGYPGIEDEEYFAEFPDDATEKDIDKECQEALNVLINNLDSGWYEVDTEVKGKKL